MGPVAAGEPRPLRAGLPRRLSDLPSRHRVRAQSLADDPAHRAAVLRLRQRASPGVRALPRHGIHVAAGHLRRNRDPRVGHPVGLDGGLSSLRNALRQRLHAGGALVRPDAGVARFGHRRRALRRHLGLAPRHVRGQGAARQRRGPGDGRGVRGESPGPGPAPVRSERGLRGRGWDVHRAHLDPGSVSDLGLGGRGLRGGDHRGAGQSRGRAPGRSADRCQRVGHHGHRGSRLGAPGLVLDPHRAPGTAPGTSVSARPRLFAVGLLVAGLVLSTLPAVGLPAFYESFLYLIFFWVALATSWSILSGYAGYFSFGHGAFFGAGMYTTATLATAGGVPFLWTLPVAALVSALLGAGIGSVVFRVKRLRGELFGLLTLAITFVLATIVLNTAIDGGPGVYLSGVPLPRLVASPTGTLYLLGLGLALVAVGTAYAVARSRLGLGLFAIHDDEDVAEVKGVPTFRYKLGAFALSSAIAGTAGGIHAMYVGYVTVGETFSITVPLSVVLMSVLGGARHWLGPSVGATIITASLYVFTTGDRAVLGRALVAFVLILVILLLPEGVVPAVLQRWRTRRRESETASGTPTTVAVAAGGPGQNGERGSTPVLECRHVSKAFGGIQALRGVDLTVGQGEIVGLVGPNGSGKTTLIN